MSEKLAFGLILIAIVATGVANSSLIGDSHGQQDQDTMATIKARGFIGEMYTIHSNGYPLYLYRIINPLANPATLNKYPVLYGHGVYYDSMSMISRSENSRPRKPVIGKPTINYGDYKGADDTSLPFMLSNNNFDVWLFDARGTTFMKENNSTLSHINMASKVKDQWDYSLDEESIVDLPKLIDFVLAKTKSNKLVYVGFSESTFFMFALLSTAPDYADKVAAFIAMAPVAYVSHIKGLVVSLLGPLTASVPDFMKVSVNPEIMLDLIDKALKDTCKTQEASTIVCGSLINAIGGRGTGQNSPELYKHFFKATSLKALKHFFQLYLGKRFGMYDYGELANLQKYGQTNPPGYDLRRVRSDRIILFRGLADFLSTPEDQAQLVAELGVKPYLDFILPAFNHFDFMDGKDVIKLVNGPAVTAIYQLMYHDGPSVLKDTRFYRPVVSPFANALPIATTYGPPITAKALTPQSSFPTPTPIQSPLSGLPAGGLVGAATQAIRDVGHTIGLGDLPLSALQTPESYQSHNLLQGENISDDPSKFVAMLAKGNPDPLGLQRTFFSPLGR